jgi:hypothetical protein
MTQITGVINSENDDLICPITLELFRDPVIAEDGHVYEREAITRWILEHGTSPLTREPLQVNNLQSDHHLRRLAAQRRNLTVSYNTRNNFVTLPPLRRVPRNERQALQQALNQITTNYQTNTKYACRTICCCVILFITIVSTSLGIVYGIKNSNSYPNSTSIIELLYILGKKMINHKYTILRYQTLPSIGCRIFFVDKITEEFY